MLNFVFCLLIDNTCNQQRNNHPTRPKCPEAYSEVEKRGKIRDGQSFRSDAPSPWGLKSQTDFATNQLFFPNVRQIFSSIFEAIQIILLLTFMSFTFRQCECLGEGRRKGEWLDCNLTESWLHLCLLRQASLSLSLSMHSAVCYSSIFLPTVAPNQSSFELQSSLKIVQ